VNESTNEDILSKEEAIKEQLEELKFKVKQLHNDIPCLKQCSRLGDLLQKIYEIRMGINQLEQGLLQTHLKCCISPKIKVPGEVILALSKLSEKRHGAIIVMEQADNLDEHLQGGVIIDAVISAPILENIFYPGSPLHDGAVIIRDSKIRKASVLLPLAPHTSALDALGLKGWISMALKGQLYPDLGTFALLEKLENSMENGK